MSEQILETTREPIFKLKGKALVCVDWANVFGWSDSLKWSVKPEKLFAYFKDYPEVYQQNFYFGEEKGNTKSEEFQKIIQAMGFNLRTKEVKWIPVYLEKQNHLKKAMRNVFDILDRLIKSNSEISNRLYQLKHDFEKSIKDSEPVISGDFGDGGTPTIYGVDYAYDEDAYNNLFDLIEELDGELKKLNIDIGDLQRELKKPLKRRKCDFDCEIVMDIMKEMNNFESLILVSGDGDYKAIVEHVLDNKKQAIVIHPFGRRGYEFDELLDRETNRPYFCSAEKLKVYLA